MTLSGLWRSVSPSSCSCKSTNSHLVNYVKVSLPAIISFSSFSASSFFANRLGPPIHFPSSLILLCTGFRPLLYCESKRFSHHVSYVFSLLFLVLVMVESSGKIKENPLAGFFRLRASFRQFLFLSSEQAMDYYESDFLDLCRLLVTTPNMSSVLTYAVLMCLSCQLVTHIISRSLSAPLRLLSQISPFRDKLQRESLAFEMTQFS